MKFRASVGVWTVGGLLAVACGGELPARDSNAPASATPAATPASATPASAGALAAFGVHGSDVVERAASVSARDVGFSLTRTDVLPGATAIGSAPREVLEVGVGDAVTIRLANGRTLALREEGVTGSFAPSGHAVRAEREGGASYWTVADGLGFEEWLDVEAGRAFADRAIAHWAIEGMTFRAVPETGGAHVIDVEGRPVAYVEAPHAWDEDGTAVTTRLAIEGDRLALFADASGARVLVDPSWTPTGTMVAARSAFGARSHASIAGGVLAAGGQTDATILDSAERYRTATDTWSPTASMSSPRLAAITVTLADGDVLVAGGTTGSGSLASSEVFDPDTDTWSSAGTMNTSRQRASGVRLADGRVLVTGGLDGTHLTSCELFDPASHTFGLAASMSHARSGHSAVLLLDGRVLVVGWDATAEVYSPATDAWSDVGTLVANLTWPSATRLPDGRVLVAGGNVNGVGPSDRAWVFDPTTDTFGAMFHLAQQRHGVAAALTSRGRVLLTGGFSSTDGALDTTESFDPSTNSLSPGLSFSGGRLAHGLAVLDDRRLLLFGGSNELNVSLATSEVFADDPLCGNGVVETGEQCDDGNTLSGDCCTSTCNLEAAGQVCRTAAGDCDVAEVCTGASGLCPSDAFVSMGTSCRAANGECDVAETCSGSSAACPNDAFAGAGTSCRAANGECDVAETCTGSANSCPADLARAEGTSCGGAPSGTCDAQDQCVGTTGASATCAPRFASSSTSCRSASCSSGVATAPASCTGSATTCPAVVTTTCAPYLCGATACRTTCASDSECATGNYCNASGVCRPLETNGATCSRNGACSSAHCADGVCCDTGCSGQCEACDVTGSVGTCVAATGAPHGLRTACTSDGSSCGGACNGTNRMACSYPSATTSCRAGSCADGVATIAEFCNGTGRCPDARTQSCEPFMCGATACSGDCSDDDDCNDGAYCSAGVCVTQEPNGRSCSRDRMCDSAECVDGVCCESACDGQCEACDNTGALGTCTPATGAPHGGRPACASDGSSCGGRCDGIGTMVCVYASSSTTCGDGMCENGTATGHGSCDGTGACSVSSDMSCAPYACGATSCLTTCSTTSDCAAGFECASSACVEIRVDAGVDAGVDGDGGVVETDAAVDAGDGDAGVDAGRRDGGSDASARDGGSAVADGAAIDGALADGATIDAMGEDASLDGGGLTGGGCGCRTSGPTRTSGAWSLLALALLARRRRR